MQSKITQHMNNQENLITENTVNRCQFQDDIDARIVKDFKIAIITMDQEVRANNLEMNEKINKTQVYIYKKLTLNMI